MRNLQHAAKHRTLIRCCKVRVRVIRVRVIRVIRVNRVIRVYRVIRVNRVNEVVPCSQRLG